MKIVKKTGLVPVHTKANKRAFGLPPAEALKGVRAGTLFLVDIPDDIETDEWPNAEVAIEPNQVGDEGLIAIPDDWQSLQWLRIVKLAKDIFGADFIVPDGEKPLEVATNMLRAEVERRKNPDGLAPITENPADAAGSEGTNPSEGSSQPANTPPPSGNETPAE